MPMYSKLIRYVCVEVPRMDLDFAFVHRVNGNEGKKMRVVASFFEK